MIVYTTEQIVPISAHDGPSCGLRVEAEDGGNALIFEPDSQDECFFVCLQSWDITKRHALMNELLGKKIKITIEVLD